MARMSSYYGAILLLVPMYVAVLALLLILRKLNQIHSTLTRNSN